MDTHHHIIINLDGHQHIDHRYFSLIVLTVESIEAFLCVIMFHHQHLHPDEGCWGIVADHGDGAAVPLQVFVKWSQEMVSVASWMATTNAGNARRERQI